MTVTRPRSRIGVRFGDSTVDVAVPTGVPLYTVLREATAGLDLAPSGTDVVVVDSAGGLIDPYSATSDGLPEGTVLHVLTRPQGDGTSGTARSLSDRPDPATTRPTSVPWQLGLAVAAAGVLAVSAGLQAIDGAHGPGRGLLALLLMAAALALAVRPPRSLGSAWPTAVAALTAFAGGATTVTTSLPGAGQLMVVAGLVSALAVTAVRWAVAHRARDSAADLAGALLVVLAGAAVTCAVVLLAGLPGLVAAAILLGVSPLALRILPTLCVDVPDEQLLDVTPVARTVAAVRAPQPKPLGQVNERMVQRSVAGAARRHTAGTAVLSVVGPVTVPVVLIAAAHTTLTRSAAIAACLLVAAAQSLLPRTARGGLARWAPRGSAAVILLEVGLVVGAGSTVVYAMAAAAVGIGLLAVMVSLPLGRGWRSVGFSRLADAVETLATVLALPVALVAAGAVDLLRQLTSH